MKSTIAFFIIGLIQTIMAVEVNIVSRSDWGARPPKDREDLKNPVPFVVIHHTYIPGACYTSKDCTEAVRSIQNMHMDDNGWSDIGYNFLVGGDMRVYTGRGWNTVGAHAPTYNNKSIGICFIGDYQEVLPPEQQMDIVKALMEMGVKEKWIDSNYTLLGHRQTRPTECPGQKLYEEISTWPHYSPFPEPPPTEGDREPIIVPRKEWGAVPAKKQNPMKTPVSIVVIIHSYIPPVCRTTEDCILAVKSMQNYHMNSKGWDDIAYNFVVGGDNKIYEGRGWSQSGAHSKSFNNKTIGICFVGDFTNELPPILAIDEAKEFIKYGVRNGYIAEDYILVGHNQLINTQSPGNRLIKEIKTWPHYSEEKINNAPIKQIVIKQSPCSTTEDCAFKEDLKFSCHIYIANDGNAYPGRPVGAGDSLHICFFGNFKDDLPLSKPLRTMGKIIEAGVSKGHVHHKYSVHSHLQESGKRLQEKISSWPNYVPRS